MESFQRFFDFMSQEHGLTLLHSEMNDIIQEALLCAKENGIELLIKNDDDVHTSNFRDSPINRMPKPVE